MIYILLKYFKYIYIKKNVQIHKNVYKLLVSIAFSSSLYYTNVIDVSPSYFTKHIQHQYNITTNVDALACSAICDYVVVFYNK